jgi:hypothetical protein
MAFFVFYSAVAGWKGLRVIKHFQERAHTVRNLLFAPQIADINVLYCRFARHMLVKFIIF